MMKFIFERWWLYIPYRIITYIPVVIFIFFMTWYEIMKDDIYDPIVGKWQKRTRKEYNHYAQPPIPKYKDMLLYNNSWPVTLTYALMCLITAPLYALLIALFISIVGTPLM